MSASSSNGDELQADPSMSTGSWSDYWERIDDKQYVFRVEASDYVARLRRLIQPATAMAVLDFGCGFGYVAAELSGNVRRIALWDASATVRRQASERVRGLENVEFVDLESMDSSQLGERFDLILAHSVVQYMTPAEILVWLARWRTMLNDRGRIVLSDLILPGAGGLGELLSYLRFAYGRGFFWKAFTDGVAEIPQYWKARNNLPLTSATRQQWETWAEQSGLRLEWLPENLSHRQARSTAVFQSMA